MATRRNCWAALLVALALTWAFAPRAGAVLVHWGPKGSKMAAGVLPRRGVNSASIPGSFARKSASSSTAAPPAGTLAYHGGPVLHAETPYLIYWDPNNEITASQKAHLAQYLADAAAASGSSSNIYGVDRQFTDTTGFADYKQTWSSGQAITDTQPYPSTGQCNVSARVVVPTCLYDSQIQAEVVRLINAQGLPTGTSGSAPIYFVVTPPSVDTCNTGGSTVCADNYYCAYHGVFQANGHNILYSDLPTYLDATNPKGCQFDGNPQVQEPNGDQITDVVTSSMSHEFSETITDPITDSTLGNGGWYDATSGNEDGDNCAFYAASADPAHGNSPYAFQPTLGGSAAGVGHGTLYDQVINGNHYYTQTEWSNAGAVCRAQPTSSAITAAFSAPASVSAGASASFDPSASSVAASYSSSTWSFGDGSGAFSRSAPASKSASLGALDAAFTASSALTQVGSMVAFDASSSAVVTSRTVSLTLVDVYGNLSKASHVVNLTGTGSPTLSYSWDFGDGSPPDTSGASPSHVYGSPGTHTVTLTISNGTFSKQISHPIKIDAVPSATFAQAPASPLAGSVINFDGTGSSETSGTISSYSWDFGDGSPVDTTATPSHRYGTPGTYTVTLTVTDQDGYTAQVAHSVVVDSPPIPTFSVSAGPRAGSPVAFDGSASNEPGGSITSYTWNYGDGSAGGSGATTSHTYASPGTYTVTLTVTDAKGRTASAAQNLTVAVASAPPPPATVGSPSAAISVTTSHPVAGATVAFSGSGSADRGSTLVAYNWSFGDGGSATGVTPGHRYAHPGTYAVTLTVRDATGSIATTSLPVTVKSAGITGVTVKTSKTVERLTLSLSGPGTLTSGKLKLKIQQAGSRVVTHRLTGAQRRRLRSHHAVTVSLKLRFSPTVGSASSRTVRFKISP